MKPVRLSLEADAEFTAAKDWYAQIDPLLADRFYLVVKTAINEIRQFPKASPPYDKTYRHYPLRRFPYIIFYTELDDYVLIDAVAHQSREPNYWKKEK